jgi:hypothetical protein
VTALSMTARHKPRARVPRVGSMVSFLFGGHEVTATVLEDRGPIGINGRQILRVRLELEATEPIEFELPAEYVWTA